jgi:ATP/maltotriose-dependent transcriptional regulator MalT
MHGRARRALGEPAAALADLRRGAALARQTGRERLVLLLTVESVAALIDLGRLAEATALAQDGVERARLAGNPRMLLWAQSTLATARLAAGDITGALRDAERAAVPQTRADFHAAGQPGWALGAALTAAGNAERAVPVLLDAFGGPGLPHVLPADRPAAAADLVDAQLALGDIAAAEATLARAEAAAPAMTGLARATVLLAQARPQAAVDAAAAAHEAAAGAPYLAARALLAQGRALAAAGDRHAAVHALTSVEAAFDGFGAARRRDEAVRELRRLGHRVSRRTRRPDDDPLTAREREIAELAATGRSNREIAEQLVLSPRTIETHLRNIYAKLAVRSRVQLIRALQPSADPPASSTTPP